MPPKDVGLAILVQVIWGVGFTLTKPTMEAFPPLLFVTLVYIVISLVLSPLAGRSRTPFGWMMLIAALGGSGQSCLLTFGLNILPATTSNLLLQLTVPFAILMSWCLGIDRPSLRNGLGSIVALAGVAIVIGAPGAENPWAGVIAIALGALSWAAAQILIASLVLEQGQLGWLARATPQDWGALIGIALFGFAGGYMLWYRLLVRTRIDQLLPFTLLMPPVGVAAGALALDEPLRASLLTGGVVILAGLAVIVWPSRRTAPRAPERVARVPERIEAEPDEEQA